ncbi:hypothetical protein FRC17_001217 [Serendipita sp. 399]|nr:hypothetical protein FRC17_001217 [Serendipita sp. 399]
MALVPIVNAGKYRIRNIIHGLIRNDEGALGAKGTSKDDELVWQVNRNSDGTYDLQTLGDDAGPASAGIAISEIEKRYYVSVEASGAVATKWRLQPIFSGSDPRILYVIYQLPQDNNCPAVGHWELNNSDKKEPVKLNRFPEDEENKSVPTTYSPNALWTLEPASTGVITDTDDGTYGGGGNRY